MNVKTKTVRRRNSKPIWEVTQWHRDTLKDLIVFDDLKDAKKHVRNVFATMAFSNRFEIREVHRSIVMWRADPKSVTRNPQHVMSEVHRRRWDMSVEKKVGGKWKKVKGMLIRGSDKHKSSRK